MKRRMDNGIILGVCSGFGAEYGFDPIYIRIGIIALACVTAFVPVVVGYLIVSVLMES